MSCGCNSPFGNNSTPWSAGAVGDPWAIPNPNAQVPVGGIWGQPASTALVEVVFDPTTNQIRPLRPGEQSPGTDCGTCMKIDALAPPSKQLVQMYWDLFRRVKNLEQKYCNCICGPSTPPPAVELHITGVQFNQETRDLLITRSDGVTYTQNIPGGGEFTQVPDQWRSGVISVSITVPISLAWGTFLLPLQAGQSQVFDPATQHYIEDSHIGEEPENRSLPFSVAYGQIFDPNKHEIEFWVPQGIQLDSNVVSSSAFHLAGLFNFEDVEGTILLVLRTFGAFTGFLRLTFRSNYYPLVEAFNWSDSESAADSYITTYSLVKVLPPTA